MRHIENTLFSQLTHRGGLVLSFDMIDPSDERLHLWFAVLKLQPHMVLDLPSSVHRKLSFQSTVFSRHNYTIHYKGI